MIAKASNIDVLFFFVSLHRHTNLHFEDQVKIAKLMSHSIFTNGVVIFIFVTYYVKIYFEALIAFV